MASLPNISAQCKLSVSRGASLVAVLTFNWSENPNPSPRFGHGLMELLLYLPILSIVT